MTDIDIKDQFNYILKSLSANAFEEKKYFDALEYAIAAHIATRETEENKTALFLLWQAVEMITIESKAKPKTGKKGKQNTENQLKCSFCDRSYPDPPKNLVAGPGVFICRPCVKLIYEDIFQEHN